MKWRCLSMALLACAACRAVPGPSKYDKQERFSEREAGSDADPEFLPGPDPYQPGSKRLSVGIFYEGGSSQAVAIDNTVTHFYVYEQTFSLERDTDRLEGLSADRIVHAGGPWWGGGIAWNTPRDLSAWSTLHISLRSEDAGFADVDLSMSSASTAKLSAAKYGYKNDGMWHSLAVPLADFVAEGLDATQVSSPLVIGGGTAKAAEALLIDDVYFAAEAP